MNNDYSEVIYEFPLNNRIRYFLRFEFLARNLDRCLSNIPQSNIEALRLLFELTELTRNMDIKSEAMQHIRWQIQELQSMSNDPQVHQENLTDLVNRKEMLLTSLEQINLPVLGYQNHHFLSSVKRRFEIPGGICSFDIPMLATWRHLPAERQLRDLREWYKPFLHLSTSIYDCLELSRNCRQFSDCVAEGGYYSQNFKMPGPVYQLIRIKLDENTGIYPEISAGRPRFTTHFFEISDLATRPKQVKSTIQFKVALCQF